MKIELKRINFSESLSEETNAYTADLWINGKKVGQVKNNGQGGETDIYYDKANRHIIEEAEAYCKSLPPIKTEYGDKSFEFNITLDYKVDIILEEWLKKKEEAKNFNKGLCYRTPQGKEMMITWKQWTISKLMKNPNGILTLKRKILELKKEGNTIMNTNLANLV